MTPDQIERLAAMGNTIRPDWPVASLRTFITNNLHWRAYGDTAVALTFIATKTETQTPRLLLEQTHMAWRAARMDDPNNGMRMPPKHQEQCDRHPGEYAGASCRCCASERLADRDEPQVELGGRPRGCSSDEWLARARAALTTADLCTHGVTPVACPTCRATTQTTTPADEETA